MITIALLIGSLIGLLMNSPLLFLGCVLALAFVSPIALLFTFFVAGLVLSYRPSSKFKAASLPLPTLGGRISRERSTGRFEGRCGNCCCACRCCPCRVTPWST